MRPVVILMVVFMTSLMGNSLKAQNFAYVDTDYILNKLPSYRSAKKRLDDIAQKWRKEIQSKVDEVDKMYKEYQAEKVLLPKEEKQKREKEIMQKEKELKKFKESKFGEEGELYQKRKELIQPIQDKVFNAVQKLAKEESLDFIFDKSNSATTMLYTNAQYDKSDEVLKKMGIDPEKQPDQSSASESKRKRNDQQRGQQQERKNMKKEEDREREREGKERKPSIDKPD